MPSWMDLPRPWLLLAPMAGVADWPFREICYGLGAEVALSHLVPVAGLIANPRRVLPTVGAGHGSRPFIAQLIGSNPEDFRHAARVLTDALPIAGIDINMGCPVAPVVSAGSGSALLRQPERAAAIVAATCAGTRLPVTVKLRTGWDSPDATRLAPLLQAAGARALIVHGRTREQLYNGAASLEAIAETKRAVSIPVVGNGDVVSIATARHMLECTGVDGIMVGRGALGNPWLFAALQANLKGNHQYRRQQLPWGEQIRHHARLAFADQGPKAARTMRKHLIAYARGSPSAAQLRKALETLSRWDDLLDWISALEASTLSIKVGNKQGRTGN